ncbi:MAG: NAD(P)-binding protein [Methylocystis sp.]|uniref:NAD(P)-binding protein n=1 Tax=Methylocystis sp. TaxID=1911079 RepID=UPI003DA6040B
MADVYSGLLRATENATLTPSSSYEKHLGMQRSMSRRDFLNGVAIGAGMALAEFPDPAGGEPAGGFQGQTDQSFAIMHALRDGRFWENAGTAEAADAPYDLIVVGAGISGLAAAFLYRQQAGAGARILVLENSPSFGGHAVRNEFTASNGRRILGYGGSKSLQTPSFFSAAVSTFMTDVGIDVGKFDQWFDRRWAADRGLGPAVFLGRETFGADGLFRTDGAPAEWIARTPLDERAKGDLVKILSAPADPFKGKSRAEKLALLSQTTYEAFLLQILSLHPQVAAYLADSTKSYFGVGTEAVTCLDARAMGAPGFDAMDLGDAVHPTLSPSGRLMQRNPDPYIHHFPDGNASLARAILRRLLPEALPGESIEDLLLARVDDSHLDRDGSRTRIRLGAPCVRVRNVPNGVEVCYVKNGKLRQASAGHVILACWHRVIPLLTDELAAEQRQALDDQQKVPLIYTNVLLRSWEAFARLGVAGFRAPGAWWEGCWIDEPVSIGSYRFADKPGDPVLLHLGKVVLDGKGDSAREQARLGRHMLAGLAFSEVEFHLRDLLARALGNGGFDPARDIEAIAVNRWSHGYSYEYMRPWDAYWPDGKLPIMTARRGWGRIAIANSDSGAYAYAHSAIDQAARAVRDLLGAPEGAPAYASFPGPPEEKIGLK